MSHPFGRPAHKLNAAESETEDFAVTSFTLVVNWKEKKKRDTHLNG